MINRIFRALACAGMLMSLTAAPAAALHVQWLHGIPAPGTPTRLDRVGVIKVGSARARNVLVLEPGTSAGAAYFVPLAQWLTSRAPGWQVWSVERRENLLEDQSELKLGKRGRASARQVFDYYLGYLTNHRVRRHFHGLNDARYGFAKSWGLEVAVGDLRRVIQAARRRRGAVVLGGHSLGGAVVTAYATWNFGGRPGAAGLAGLVYIDGSSRPAESAAQARSSLSALQSPNVSPWLAFGGIVAPYAGVFEATGALGALRDPNSRSLGQQFPLLPKALKPSVPVTNLAEYGYAQNVGTSPASLIAAQAHLGRGVAARGPIHGWDGRGALTPIRRYARMFAAPELLGADGVEWYFPQRLTDDTAAIGNGLANPAQPVLNVHSTMGRRLPHRLRILAFGAALGGQRVLDATVMLAQQSGIPRGHLTLVNRAGSYAHNDPAGAFPRNAFFTHLLTFLRHLR